MQAGAQRAKKGVLFLFGGGMIPGPDGGDVKAALRIGQRAGADVWFPDYPLCTGHCICDTYAMVLECYRQMAAEYGAESLAVLGFSSEAALALGVALHNNTLGRPLPMPGRIIACSPDAIPMTDEEWQKMLALNEKDSIIDAAFMKTDREIMEHGPSVPDYMRSGVCGDFTGLPPIAFYYGSGEVLFAEAESFTAACQKAGVPYPLTVGEGMCYCYPMQPYSPEGRQTQNEIIRLPSK